MIQQNRPTLAGFSSNQITLTVPQAMQQAIAAYGGGDWGKAERLCRLILQASADFFDGLHLLGVIAMQTGHTEEACGLLRRAVALQPNNASAHNNFGITLKNLNRPGDALASYERALAIEPGFAEAHYNRGVALQELQRFGEALASYERALKIKPGYAEAHANRGNALKYLQRYEEALTSYERALAIKPADAATHYNRGVALQELKRHDEALASYDRALIIKPDHAEAHNNRGITLQKLRRLDEALASYDRALQFRPDYADAHYNRGIALQELQRVDDALQSYELALKLDPAYAEAYSNRGNALKDLKRFEEALASYDRALTIKPDHAETHNNRGGVLQQLRRLDEALASYDRALELKPDYAEAYSNRGVTLQELNRLEEGLASYGRALTLKPDYVEVHINRGNTLKELNRLEEALASYGRALSLKPDDAEAFNNCGFTLQDMNRVEEALANYERALALKPDYTEVHINRGNALQDLSRFEEALASYRRALELKPNYEWLYGTWLHIKMRVCQWSNLSSQIEELAAGIARDEKITAPFPVIALADSVSLQRRAAEIWANADSPSRQSLPPIGKHSRRGRIRIGYYSADFHNHATTYLMAELFERHDKTKFELVAFSFGPDFHDEMRMRLCAAFDQFVDVRMKSDHEVALISRALQIDIAVDLKGFTRGERHRIFSYRAAPIQVAYLGYPGTMGVPYQDYLIADRTVIPRELRGQYAEKIVFLPNSYQVNDRRRRVADRRFSREGLGLPPRGFVFCCFNNTYKITPGTFDGWMRILKQVEGSVLWLLEDNEVAASNLRSEAEARGVGAARLIFAARLPLPEHLARHRAADLFIDTLPCNAHTTASDALWTGLPVLTCAGESFAARVAASLLNAIGLPELIAATQDHYEALAIELATDPDRLKTLREKLAENRLTTPLFDTDRFTRHIEDAYSQMYERYQADLGPDHIEVAA